MAKRKPLGGQLGLGFGMSKPKTSARKPKAAAKKNSTRPARGSALVQVSGYCAGPYTRSYPTRQAQAGAPKTSTPAKASKPKKTKTKTNNRKGAPTRAERMAARKAWERTNGIPWVFVPTRPGGEQVDGARSWVSPDAFVQRLDRSQKWGLFMRDWRDARKWERRMVHDTKKAALEGWDGRIRWVGTQWSWAKAKE